MMSLPNRLEEPAQYHHTMIVVLKTFHETYDVMIECGFQAVHNSIAWSCEQEV